MGGEEDVSMRGVKRWGTVWIAALGRYCSDHALFIVWVWLFVFSIRSLRMLGGLLYVQRIRHYGIGAVPVEWQEKVNEFCRQLGIGRAVRLVESRLVKMPLVAGHWRPMIFMPVGLLTGLPAGEIEAVLLHELAHIRRNDWLINLVQHVASNLFFFNPGYLWMSALLRDERENCCDDIAIERTCDKVQFIRALINFKEHDLRMAKVVNAFPAGKDQLLKRVTRIAHNTNKALDPGEKIFLFVSCILIALLVGVMGAPSGSRDAEVAAVRGTVQTEVRESEAGPLVEEKMQVDRVVQQARAEKDARRAVADKGARRAVGNQVPFEKDREQAKRDEEQAERDKVQAVRDKEQAVRDKEQAIKDKQQAERDALQAVMDKVQADRDAHQAILDRIQAGKDAVRAIPPIVNLKM